MVLNEEKRKKGNKKEKLNRILTLDGENNKTEKMYSCIKDDQKVEKEGKRIKKNVIKNI